jgi:hypothetical protein
MSGWQSTYHIFAPLFIYEMLQWDPEKWPSLAQQRLMHTWVAQRPAIEILSPFKASILERIIGARSSLLCFKMHFRFPFCSTPNLEIEISLHPLASRFFSPAHRIGFHCISSN